MLKRKAIQLTYENILSDAELNILRWYDFPDHAKLLSIGWNHTLARRFCEEQSYDFFDVTPVELLHGSFDKQHKNKMDIVLLMETIEVTEAPAELLKKAYACLNENGKMLVITNNRYAIKHFCGEKTPYETMLYDELEGRTDENGNHCWGIGEIETLFSEAGIYKVKKYAVYPALYYVKKIYAFDYTIRGREDMMFTPWYKDNRFVFAHEEKMYEGLIASGLFYLMADGFFFEIRKGGQESNILAATVSSGRPADRQFITVLRNNGKVEKRPVYENGLPQIWQLERNHDYLRGRGLYIVPGKMQGDIYESDYVSSPGLLEQMKTAFCNGHGEIITLFDSFVDELKKSSVYVIDDQLGEIMQHGFVDLVPQNCFYDNGRFLFFDQEYDIPQLPLKVIIYRCLVIMYEAYPAFKKAIPISFFLERYEIAENIEQIQKRERDFLQNLNLEEVMVLHKDYHAPCEAVIEANIQTLNEVSLKKILTDACKKNMEEKQIILFGANEYTKAFIRQYGKMCEIRYVIDEELPIQEKKFEGYTVCAENKLAELDSSVCKVVILTTDFLAVYQRLRRWGMCDIGLFEG